MARLFTVVVSTGSLRIAGTPHDVTVYEADFAGHHFSRTCEADLIKWVRVAARNVYGPHTQVIFLHEGVEQ